MAIPTAATPRSASTPGELTLTGIVRLAACPSCGARQRSLREAGGDMVASCLSCGRAITAALATERLASVRVIGRGGQPVGR